MARAPIAWIPLGALEFHATHLPFGTDGFTGQGLLERAAARVGGVVLPWSYLTIGTLHFPWTFRYDPALVAASVLATLRQAAAFGARAAIVHTGHAPLDLVHLLKRTCAEAEAEIGGGFRAYGLTYLELNATLGTGLGTDWPVAVDHGSILETSWMLALEPDLVDLATLPDEGGTPVGGGTAQAAAPIVGVYGPNPRAAADADRGREQVEAAAALLAERAALLLTTEPFDTLADLRGFVARYWPEPMRLGAIAGPTGVGALTLTNDGPVSRYLTGVELRIDGVAIPPGRDRPRQSDTRRAAPPRRGRHARARIRVLRPAGPDRRTALAGWPGARPARGRADRGAGRGDRRDPHGRRRGEPRMTAATGLAMTVTGPVDPATLGVTLIHEHVLMDSLPLLAVHGYATEATGPYDAAHAAEARWNPGTHPDNYRVTDRDTAVEELGYLVASGGGTIVDVTPLELGRDPGGLAEVAARTGLHIVMGGGHYLGPLHAPELATRSASDIADALIAEWRDGVAGTGIRPGILGEIGTSDPPLPGELRVLQAVAIASRATGLAISVHLHPWGRTGELVADTLLDAGAAPDRVVLGHLTTAHDDRPYLERLATRGTGLAFDLFGFDHSLLGAGRYPPSDADVAATVIRLVRDGLGGRLFLSQDVGVRSRLRRYGGWGYDHLLRHVVPLLSAGGLARTDIDQLLVANPRRILTMAPPA